MTTGSVNLLGQSLPTPGWQWDTRRRRSGRHQIYFPPPPEEMGAGTVPHGGGGRARHPVGRGGVWVHVPDDRWADCGAQESSSGRLSNDGRLKTVAIDHSFWLLGILCSGCQSQASAKLTLYQYVSSCLSIVPLGSSANGLFGLGDFQTRG